MSTRSAVEVSRPDLWSRCMFLPAWLGGGVWASLAVMGWRPPVVSLRYLDALALIEDELLLGRESVRVDEMS